MTETTLRGFLVIRAGHHSQCQGILDGRDNICEASWSLALGSIQRVREASIKQRSEKVACSEAERVLPEVTHTNIALPSELSVAGILHR